MGEGAAIEAGERIYAIGDVHGRLDLLADLLGMIRRDQAGRPEARVRVILLGDVTAEQLRSLDADATDKIEKQVARGAGLMVLGGYVNLGNGGWRGIEAMERMLPVDLSETEQYDKPVSMQPTADGLRLAKYLFRLDDNPDLYKTWAKLAKLDGRKVNCGKRPTVLNSNFDSWGGAFPGFLILNTKKITGLSTAVKLYVYSHECGHQFEAFESIKADPQRVCPSCQKERLRRKIGPGAAILFKGSGFYQTDYRSESYKKRAKEEKAPSTPAPTNGQGAPESSSASSTPGSAATKSETSKPASGGSTSS